MHPDLARAIQLLNEGNYTCVLCRGTDVITDTRRGIRPLLELLESTQDLCGAFVADKVVGKAAAMLYCLMGVGAIHAGILSRPAEQMLRRYGIHVSFDTLVDAIRNRAGDGFCPMETAVWELDEHTMAPAAIKTALIALANQ